MTPVVSFTQMFSEARKHYGYWHANVVVDFAIRAHKEMKRQGLSIKQLAERAKMCVRTVHLILGAGEARMESWAKLSFALNAVLGLRLIPLNKAE